MTSEAMPGPDADGIGPVPFVGRRIPPSFERRVVVIAPGHTRTYKASEWQDAIVLVHRGKIDLLAFEYSPRRFVCGDILVLDGLGLRALYNPEREPAVLIAISRRAGTAEHSDEQ